MITFTFTNVEEVIQHLQAGANIIVEKLMKSMTEGMEYFSGNFIKTQLSGRKEADFGLKVRTGTLRNSWTVRGEGTGMEDYSVRLATWVKYARIHQYGGATGKNHKAIIPKRLYLLESFRAEGFSFIQKAVDKNLAKLIKIG